MLRKLPLSLSILTFALYGCTLSDDASKPVDGSALPAIMPPPAKPAAPTPAYIEQLLVIGAVENVILPTAGMRMEARIDTGATTSSIDARDVKLYERDGKKWVSFRLFDRVSQKSSEIELPLKRTVLIKRHNAKSSERYVVELPILMGNISTAVEFTLADRESFEYPVLIGRNFLNGRAVVDVGSSFLTSNLRVKHDR